VRFHQVFRAFAPARPQAHLPLRNARSTRPRVSPRLLLARRLPADAKVKQQRRKLPGTRDRGEKLINSMNFPQLPRILPLERYLSTDLCTGFVDNHTL